MAVAPLDLSLTLLALLWGYLHKKEFLLCPKVVLTVSDFENHSMNNP